MSRENFRSRLGFILVSAGCAIGIGNVWKFPYVTGVNGGGVFVLFYIISLVIMGVPILTMELAVGRASRVGILEHNVVRAAFGYAGCGNEREPRLFAQFGYCQRAAVAHC